MNDFLVYILTAILFAAPAIWLILSLQG